MPDITMPYLPTAGAATSAVGFNNDVYDPSATPSSLEVINGWLGSTNRDAAWKVPYHKIRPGSMTSADSVGATVNQDFFLLEFPVSPDATGAFVAISGTAKGHYVDYASGVLIFSASVVEANSIARSVADGAKLRLYYKGPTDTEYSAYGSSQQQVCAGGTTTARKAYWDRQYSFDRMIINPAVGQHEFFIGLWATGAYATLANVSSLRARVRLCSTIYIP